MGADVVTDQGLPGFIRDRLADEERTAREAGSRRVVEPLSGGEHWRWEHVADGELPDPDADIAAESDIINGRHDVDRWPVALRSVETYATGSVGDLQHNVIPHMDEMGVREARHIELHDPARVLAFVAAGRALLAVHCTPADAAPDDWRVPDSERTGWRSRHCVGCGRGGICDDPHVEDIDRCPTLRAFALTWAGHPTYRAAWASDKPVTAGE